MMLLQVQPEASGQLIRMVSQGPVVDRGLAFFEVVHEQVADGAAGDRVAVDQFLHGTLPGAADLPQGGNAGSEDARLSQHSEGRRTGVRPAAKVGFGVEDFQDVADGDVGEPAAFGSDDHGGAEEDVASVSYTHLTLPTKRIV